jgi:8-amino-7-oxononanoate synthase
MDDDEPVGWDEWSRRRTDAIHQAGQWRSLAPFDARGPRGRRGEPGQATRSDPVISFASNDYLGLSVHPAPAAAARAAIDRWGTGSGAARLVVGSRPVHHELEAELADWRHSPAALVLPTGFAANLAVLSTFGVAGVRILSDELNHASIIDGTRLARAEVAVYRHGDVEHLGRRLDEARTDGVARCLVVTDTVFSMDGDLAPVAAIAELCRAHRALLVLDEAHAVLGPDLDQGELDGIEVLRVGTLSKTLGSLGGFVAASRRHVDLLVNLARPFIFTTAPTPADTAAGLAALGVVRSPEGTDLKARLARHVERLAPGHPSPIIPVVVGDERDALALADALLDDGILVPAIRPPTVAPGTSRLRVALSAAHDDDDLTLLIAALAAHGYPPRGRTESVGSRA